jgi:hypothetical protein
VCFGVALVDLERSVEVVESAFHVAHHGQAQARLVTHVREMRMILQDRLVELEGFREVVLLPGR